MDNVNNFLQSASNKHELHKMIDQLEDGAQCIIVASGADPKLRSLHIGHVGPGTMPEAVGLLTIAIHAILSDNVSER